jgi:hypothetical protein
VTNYEYLVINRKDIVMKMISSKEHYNVLSYDLREQKPGLCGDTSCRNCKFSDDNDPSSLSTCAKRRKKWLDEQYEGDVHCESKNTKGEITW